MRMILRMAFDSLYLRYDRPQAGGPGVQSESVYNKQQNGQNETGDGRDEEPPGPWIFSRLDLLHRRLPGWRQPGEFAADAPDLVRRRAQVGLQLASVCLAISAAESQQQAQVVNLENIRQVFGIVAGQERLQVLKKNFSRHVRIEQFLLQWLARPVGEDWIL